MKKIFIMTILTIFISCDNDTPETHQAPQNMLREKQYPDNAENPYDGAGQLYSQIIERYYAMGLNPTATAGTIADVETVAHELEEFRGVMPEGYISPKPSFIDNLVTGGADSAADVIANSPLSVKGRLSLSSFIDTLMAYGASGASYEEIYKYTIGYESLVNIDTFLTLTDKKIILTTSSIARHSFYVTRKKRPRDRDWDTSWGNIVAGTAGSEESPAKAIVMAAVVGVELNK